MPKIKYRRLKNGEFKLLYLIWQIQREGGKATRALLSKRLRVSPSVIDGIIHDLRRDISPRSYILSKPLPQDPEEEKKRAKPIYFYVLAEKSLITKPKSAAMLLQLRRHPRVDERMVDRRAFTRNMVHELSLPEEEINQLIERAIQKKYVVTTDESGLFVADAERTLFEEPYLKLLAKNFKRAMRKEG